MSSDQETIDGGDSGDQGTGTVQVQKRSDATAAKGTLMSILGDPEFSDVVVIAGAEAKQQKFYLHRVILCLKSEFFKSACKTTFKEGLERVIKLPEIELNVFEIIIKWLYDGGYRLPDETSGKEGRRLMISHYIAADYLQIPTLRSEIMQQVASIIAVESTTEPSSPQIPKPLDLIIKVGKHAHLSDWEDLRAATEPALMDWYLNERGLTKAYNRSKSIAYPVIIEILQAALWRTYCSTCRSNGAPLEQNEKCARCQRNLGTFDRVRVGEQNGEEKT